MNDANYCTLCTECIKSCDKQNIAINLRPFGADLAAKHAGRVDEAWLAVALLCLTLFHGLSMTSAWESAKPGSMSLMRWLMTTGGLSRTASFTLGMAVVMALPALLYWLSCVVAAKLAGPVADAKTLFVQYAWSLIPVALFYHLAHNAMHLFSEGGHAVSMISDPMGTGANYFGTAKWHVGALLSDEVLWALQVGLILIGHVFGIVVASRIGHRLYAGDKKAALRSLLPMLILMVLLSCAGLGLMHLDMNMRVGRM